MMAWLAQISLRNPWWLLLAMQPLLLWLLVSLRQRLHRDDFADASLLPWVMSTHRNRGGYPLLRQLSLILAWCTLAVAMAGPRILQRVIGNDEASYLKMQVVVDESYSMSARDVTPTRLQRIKLELHDLIDRLQQTRMGLIVYAARAHVMIPPTSDKTVLRHAVDALRVRELPTEGSDMFNALDMARQQLAEASQRPRAILLISDGEVSDDSAQAQQRLTNLVTTLRQDNIRLYTLGVGTQQGAALLNDQNGWLQHNGRTVVTRLHETRLQQLAQAGNGAYAEVADDDSEWQALYDTGIARLRQANATSDHQQLAIWQDLSPWFVLPGVVLLLLAYLRLPALNRSVVPLLLLCTAVAIGVLPFPSAQAAEEHYPDAYALYQAGKYQQAAQEFARLPGYRARMGEGASLYQLQQYPKAATVYIQAVLDANSDKQRSTALFNLGNSYFKQQNYVRAATTYRDVLRYQPHMSEAKTNLAFAQALQEKAMQQSVPMTKHAGTGSRMAPAAPDTEVGKGRVGLDESESKTPEQRPAQIDTSPQKGNSRQLLEQAKPATEQIELNKDVQWTYDITRARDIPQRDTGVVVDASVFWQRLYESEEDFPAPRERPEVLPGVPPW